MFPPSQDILKGTFSWEVQPYHFPEMAKTARWDGKTRSRQQDELRTHHITEKDIKAHRQEKNIQTQTQESINIAHTYQKKN